jgi:hypothetical protein
MQDVLTKPFPIETATSNAHVTVAQEVHILGFPMGLGVAGLWPVWLTGHIASDPWFDVDERPAFLADVRVREGMSGSPVVVTTNLVRSHVGGGGYSIIAKPGPPSVYFVGVYSSRVDARLDIGCVWRPHVIGEILSGQIDERAHDGRFNAQLPDPPLIDADGMPIVI